MGGTSQGLDKHEFINCRISTGGKPGKESRLLYVPAHTRTADGKPISARLIIPILVNRYRKENPNSYRLVAWGPLADLFAKNLSQGKQMTFICDGESYWGNVFYSDGTQVLQKDGSALQTKQLSFTIREFSWGDESNRTEQEEINAGMKSGEGRRPAQWRIPGTPDNLAWEQIRTMRKQTFYQGGDKFGYAHVIAPKYPAQVHTGDQSKILQTYAQPVAPVTGLPAATSPLVNQVQNTLNPAPGTPAVQPLPAAQTVQPVIPAAAPAANALPVYQSPPA